MLQMVGLAHGRAPLRLLERAAVRQGGCGPLLASLRAAGCVEAVVLSTCSRTEVYVVSDLGRDALVGLLAEHCGVAREELHSFVEAREGRCVAEHLFGVASGLVSRVVGENEIHGQVRAALIEAEEHAAAGPVLERLFGTALLCGRRVRAETSLGGQGRSLARRAVDVGLASVTGTPAPVVAVVGAGRMAAVAVDQLTQRGHPALVVARDLARAARLVPEPRARAMGDLVAVLATADLVICATSATRDVVRESDVRAATDGRPRRPVTLVDLSLPRNIDATVAALPHVTLIGLKDLSDDTSSDDTNSRALRSALAAGAAVVASVLQRYQDDVAAAAAGPAIAAMREAVLATCRRELASVPSRSVISEDDITRIAHALTGKLLHRPTLAVRAAAVAGDHEALRELSGLFSVP